MKKFLALVFLLAFFFGCSSKKLEKQNTEIPIVNFSGVKPYLSSVSDTVYVINFWATWCAPCVKEFPYFEEVLNRYKNRKVKVLMINLDFPNQLDKSLKPFLAERESRLNVIVLDDPNQNEWINKVDSTWSGALPATLIYKGSDRVFYEGPVELSDLTVKIDSLLLKP